MVVWLNLCATARTAIQSVWERHKGRACCKPWQTRASAAFAEQGEEMRPLLQLALRLRAHRWSASTCKLPKRPDQRVGLISSPTVRSPSARRAAMAAQGAPGMVSHRARQVAPRLSNLGRARCLAAESDWLAAVQHLRNRPCLPAALPAALRTTRRSWRLRWRRRTR